MTKKEAYRLARKLGTNPCRWDRDDYTVTAALFPDTKPGQEITGKQAVTLQNAPYKPKA